MREKVKGDWENVIKSYPQLESLNDVQSSGLISSFNVLIKENLKQGAQIPSELALIMHDRYGVNPQVIEQLANVCGNKFILFIKLNSIRSN